MTNAIQKHQQDAPVAFSSREEIDALAKRIQVMLPSAKLQKWQESPKYREQAERNLHESLYKAAQLCAFYRLVPGEDVHLIPFGNGWAVDMGIETYKKAADRYCSLHGISYHLHVTEMPAEEVRGRANTDESGKSLYTPDDVGAICYLWRSDKAQVYEIFGAEKSMTKGYGIWAAKARFDKSKNEWKPDNIPVQRSKMDVAERRAMKMALKREFSLDSLLAASPGEMHDNIQIAEMKVRQHERQTALPQAQPRGNMDDEIDALWPSHDEAPEPDDDVVDAEYTTNGTHPEADFGGLGESEPDNPFKDDDAPVYIEARDKLTGNCAKLAEWAREKHMESTGPASEKQYQYLAATIDEHVEKSAHRLVLSVLCRSDISKENRPGAVLASKLLDFALKQIKNEDGEKVDNPNYRQDYVDCLNNIYRTAQGQGELLPEAEAA